MEYGLGYRLGYMLGYGLGVNREIILLRQSSGSKLADAVAR